MRHVRWDPQIKEFKYVAVISDSIEALMICEPGSVAIKVMRMLKRLESFQLCEETGMMEMLEAPEA